jgi:aspartate beta-hydroxylase
MKNDISLDNQRQIAFDHARAGRFIEAEAALAEVLAAAPKDIASLLLMGDVLHADNRVRSAGKFYASAQNLAQQSPPVQAMGAGLQRAAQRLAAYREAYARALDGAAPKEGLRPRVQQSVDLLLGRTRIYLQEPRSYYFPGLPQRHFYERAEFDWASALESKSDIIREELSGVLADHAAFRPYLERGDTEPHLQNHPLVGNADWSAFFLWKDGVRQAENCARCPQTAAAIEALPLDYLPGQAPSVLFSLLRPGAYIPPHHGMVNTRLICHLPLLVPGPAWLRVGSETRSWREGELVIFDDTVEHEAKNEASETRVVLLFDVWRPEISLDERADIIRLLTTVRDFTGEAVISGT